MKKPALLLSIAIAFDQLLNAILAGWPDETLSSRAYRMDGEKRRWTIARKVIGGIFFWQDEHCRMSFEAEKAMHHLPLEARR